MKNRLDRIELTLRLMRVEIKLLKQLIGDIDADRTKIYKNRTKTTKDGNHHKRNESNH